MGKTVAYSCSLVPCELIAAAGLRPMRIAPALGLIDSAGLIAGLCQYAGAFAAAVSQSDADAMIVTTLCDQMRRVDEVIRRDCGKPVFLMNVPATRSSHSRQLYADELARLRRFLAEVGGGPADDAKLAEVMSECDALRSTLRRRSDAMSASQFARAVLAFPDDDKSAPAREQPAAADGAVPLAIVGGELLAEDLAVLDYIESAGGHIVLNATDCGHRSLPRPFNRRRLKSDPLAELAGAYFGAIPHAFHRPNDELYRYLATELAERGVRGIVFRRYQWCDTWNAELPRLREWADMPVLELGMGYEAGGAARTTVLVQAFLEMIR